jgi:uncharacterized protein YkwD
MEGKGWLAIAVLVVVLGGLEDLLPGRFPAATDLQTGSEQIGWGDAHDADALARDIYERVNDERAARGLSPLVWHEGLAAIARGWSEEMLASGYRHSPASRRVHPDFVGVGENILMGPRDAGEAHVSWMESDGHRDNLLHGGYTAIGIGVVCRNDGHLWATQLLGVPAGGGVPRPPDSSVEPVVRRDPGPPCPPRPWWQAWRS